MKKQIVCLLVAASLAIIPATLTTGCAVTRGKESTKEYAKDKEIATRIKTSMYADSLVKGTEIKVQSLRGEVQLSGFVDNQAAKDRAGQIAANTPGVIRVYNNLLVPTGR